MCLSLGPANSVLGTDDPRAVVESTSSAVIDVLRNDGLSTERKRAEIEKIIYANVDFETMCRLVLARNWRRLSDEQQKEFVTEFKRHLSFTYGENLDTYKNERLEIFGVREEARGDRTVLTKVVRGGPNDFVMDYRLRQRDGVWRIIDVIIERVSLVSNFRSQFQEIMSSGGPERLLKLLRQKNARGKSLKS